MRWFAGLLAIFLLAFGAYAQTVPLGTKDLSGTVTTGGTFVTVDAASARQSFEFQNICNKSGNCNATTDNCYLNLGTVASPTTSNSLLVGPGGYYGRMNGTAPAGTIQVTCDGNSDKYWAQKQGQ